MICIYQYICDYNEIKKKNKVSHSLTLHSHIQGSTRFAWDKKNKKGTLHLSSLAKKKREGIAFKHALILTT